jgi:hypothetical protein
MIVKHLLSDYLLFGNGFLADNVSISAHFTPELARKLRLREISRSVNEHEEGVDSIHKYVVKHWRQLLRFLERRLRISRMDAYRSRRRCELSYENLLDESHTM